MSNGELCVRVIYKDERGVFPNKQRRFDMAHKISDDCIACGACAEACPAGAISECDGKFEVNPEECVDCGACEEVCPTGAISQN